MTDLATEILAPALECAIDHQRAGVVSRAPGALTQFGG